MQLVGIRCINTRPLADADLALACQLVEWAHRAAPRVDAETSLMARSIFSAASTGPS